MTSLTPNGLNEYSNSSDIHRACAQISEEFFFVGISNLFVEENQRLFDADLVNEEETAHAASVVPLRNALLATYGDAYIAG